MDTRLDEKTMARIRKEAHLTRVDIGRKFRLLRKHLKQTTKKTAKELNMSANKLSKIERAKLKKLNIGTVMNICEYYKVDYYSVVNYGVVRRSSTND